jgi:capsular exopolysaccharide synthesis family protein
MTALPAYGPIAESYRALRSSISFAGVDRPLRTLVVSSAEKGEGKSVTAMNLAIAMALEGRRVILVDTDLRHPTVHRLLEWEMTPGLTELLVGAVPLEAALRDHPAVATLQVITSGAMPPNPAELVNSTPMAELIQRLTLQAETVIFDCPPVLPVTDAVLLSAKVDGVLLVADIGQARRAGLKQTKEQFERARARLVGLIFNKVSAHHGGYHGYYYHRGYYGEDGPELRDGRSNGHTNGKAHADSRHPKRALTLPARKSQEPEDE